MINELKSKLVALKVRRTDASVKVQRGKYELERIEREIEQIKQKIREEESKESGVKIERGLYYEWQGVLVRVLDYGPGGKCYVHNLGTKLVQTLDEDQLKEPTHEDYQRALTDLLN